MTALERSCRRLCLRVFSRIRGGHLELVEPEGNRLRFGDPDADLAATVEIHSTTFYRALLGGSVGMGEAYRDGIWDCDDLVSLVRIAARNMGSLDRLRRRLHPMLSPVQRTLWRVPRNRKRASRRHISAHYDLGNDLFALYLDESMMYSSRRLPRPRGEPRRGHSSTGWSGSARRSSSPPRTTCSRSAPAGARWPPTRPATTAAG